MNGFSAVIGALLSDTTLDDDGDDIKKKKGQ